MWGLGSKGFERKGSMSFWSVIVFCSSAKQASRPNGNAQYICMFATHFPIALCLVGNPVMTSPVNAN